MSERERERERETVPPNYELVIGILLREDLSLALPSSPPDLLLTSASASLSPARLKGRLEAAAPHPERV